MAAFTSKATGNWSASGQTTWNEVGVPASGDTVTIGTGHAITVDTNTTVGHSPAAGDGTAAVLVNTTGTLIVASGVTFTVKGDLKLNNTTLTLNTNSILEFDASGAGTPSTARYVLQIGTANSQTSAKLIVNGTSGNRATIRSNSGGANARITDGGFISGGCVDMTHCELLRIGDASNNAFSTWLNFSAGVFSLQNVVMDACGRIFTTVSPATNSTVRLSGLTMKNTVHATECANLSLQNAIGTGVRSITGCVFDKLLTGNMLDATITDCLFYGKTSYVSNNWITYSGNLHRSTTGDENFPDDVTNCYFINETASNPHFCNIPGPPRDVTITGCVFEATQDGQVGDCVLVGTNPAAARTYRVDHCLILPSSGGNGKGSGSIMSLLGGANVTFYATHCTAMAGSTSLAAAVGETYAGHAGMLAEFKNNLIWDTSARGYKLYDSGTDDAVNDLVSAANCDFNAGYNLLAGDSGNGYNNLEFSSGSPGANDVDGVDPNFVDATRNSATWDTSLGGAGTTANALAELMKRNDNSGYNANYTIAALLTWVKAGFVPQAAALDAASDSISPSNGWIGAVEGQAGTVTLRAVLMAPYRAVARRL